MQKPVHIGPYALKVFARLQVIVMWLAHIHVRVYIYIGRANMHNCFTFLYIVPDICCKILRRTYMSFPGTASSCRSSSRSISSNSRASDETYWSPSERVPQLQIREVVGMVDSLSAMTTIHRDPTHPKGTTLAILNHTNMYEKAV